MARPKAHQLIMAGDRTLCSECGDPVMYHIHDRYVYCQNQYCDKHNIKYELPVINVNKRK